MSDTIPSASKKRQRRWRRGFAVRNEAPVLPEITIPISELRTVSLILALLLCVFYGNIVFAGKSLIYSDNYNPLDYRHTEQNYGEDFVPAGAWHGRNLEVYANFHDPGATWWQWEPSGEFFRRSLWDGEFPFWDPYVGAGAPSMANLTPAYYFPPYVVLILSGNTPIAKNVYFLLMAFSAGLFTYLFLRKHGLTCEAAFFGGAAYMFCGGLAQNAGSFVGQAASCVPLALYMTRRFLDSPSLSRTAALGVVYAGIALASFPPILVAGFGFTAIYTLWAVAIQAHGTEAGMVRSRVMLRYLFAVVISLGLVAWYYLPAFELLRSSDYVAAFYRDAGLQTVIPVCFYQLISPVLMGGSKIYLDPAMKEPFHAILPYIGITPLVAALWWSGRGPVNRNERLLWHVTLACTALVSLKLVGANPIQWVALLPGFNNIHFASYFGILLNFLLAILGALGFNSLAKRRTSSAHALVGLFAASVALLSLRQIAEAHGALAHVDSSSWVRDWALLCAIATAISIIALLASAKSVAINNRWPVLAVIIACYLIEAGWNTYYPRQNRRGIWRHPPNYVASLGGLAGMNRVMSSAVFPANAGSVYEIFSIDSLMTVNSTRIWELYKKYVSGGGDLFMRDMAQFPPEGFLDAANIKYIALRSHLEEKLQEASRRGYESAYQDDYVHIVARNSLPRYFFTSEYEVLPAEQALIKLGAESNQRRVLLETEPVFNASPNSDDDPPVEVETFGRNGYALRLSAPRPGLVYLSETRMPGWWAQVNGEPARILTANYGFRAVEIPSGSVGIRLSYWPPGLSQGLLISAAALIALLALLWLGRRERYQSETPLGEQQAGERSGGRRFWFPRIKTIEPPRSTHEEK